MSLSYDKTTHKDRIHTFSTLMGCLLILSLLGSGCKAPSTSQPSPTQGEEESVPTSVDQEPAPSQVVRESFTSRLESEEGIVVSWNGYKNGYLPGKEYLIELTIQNHTDQSWNGRFCILLQAAQSPTVISTLEDQEFTLDSGTGFTDPITIQIPETVEDGPYGLSLVVQKPVQPFVALIPIQIGDTGAVRDPATEDDLDAIMAACPPLAVDIDQLIDRAITMLNQEKNIPLGDIKLVSVETFDFPDASLGVAEPGQVYAQVITPGYIINLQVAMDQYIYHASQDRVVLAEHTSVSLHQTIEVAEANVTFEIPSSWQPANGNLIWVPEPDSDLKLGFSWQVLQPPQEAEPAFLPSPSQTLSSSEIASYLGNGRRWTMEVFGPSPGVGTPSPVESVETHVIIVVIQDSQRIGYHFYISAPTGQQLSTLEPFLEHMLESLRYISSTPG